MSAHYLFPGSFAPPTFGHWWVVKQVIECIDQLTIVCSRNPDKSDNWFTPEQAVALWQSYRLPERVTVATFDQVIAQQLDLTTVVLIRGIREPAELQYEQEVMKLNWERFDINKYLYVLAEPGWTDVSSTAARRASLELDYVSLRRMVSPPVAEALLEYVRLQKG